MKKRVSMLLLILIFSLSCFPAGIISANASTDFTEPTIYVESKTFAPGEQVKVNVNVSNNPGIAGAILKISYDSKLTLIGAENGEKFAKLSFTKPGNFGNPSTFLWDSESGQVSDDGTILTLTFNVSDDAKPNENLKIGVSCSQGDIYNENLDDVDFKMIEGFVSLKTYNLGDVNCDDVVNIRDATVIQRHIAGLEILDSDAILLADTDKDGDVTVSDATEIQKYIAGLIPSLGSDSEPTATNPSVTEPTNSSCTVIFKDYDGTVIKTENINYGESANAPDAPQRDGYIFLNWDKTFDNVTSDLVVTAQYTKMTKPTVCIQSTQASAGDNVEIPVKIYNNPGVNGMQLNVSYDSNLTLVNAENGTALSSLYFTPPGSYANPSKFLWDGISGNDTGNGVVLNLSFNIPGSAKSGEEYIINVEYPEGSIFDSDLNDVNFDIVSGSIKIK